MKDYWKHGSADVQMKIKKESDPIKSNLTLHMSFYSFWYKKTKLRTYETKFCTHATKLGRVSHVPPTVLAGLPFWVLILRKVHSDGIIFIRKVVIITEIGKSKWSVRSPAWCHQAYPWCSSVTGKRKPPPWHQRVLRTSRWQHRLQYPGQAHLWSDSRHRYQASSAGSWSRYRCLGESSSRSWGPCRWHWKDTRRQRISSPPPPRIIPMQPVRRPWPPHHPLMKVSSWKGFLWCWPRSCRHCRHRWSMKAACMHCRQC